MPWARASLKLWLCLLVLLIPGTMTDLAALNPWLSACDLTRKPPPPHDCPASHPFPTCGSEEHNQTTCQCLHYFTESEAEVVCQQSAIWQPQILAKVHLEHCYEFHALDVLSPVLMQTVNKGGTACKTVLAQLRALDAMAARVSCEFADVLRRFDCQQPYTAKFNCDHCKEAYRRWVCTTLLPFYSNATRERPRIRPCRSLCQAVEQQCPYFLPADQASGYPTQYAGEPTFLCSDATISESGEQLSRALYPQDGACCVTHCPDIEGQMCGRMCLRGEQCGNSSDRLPSFTTAANMSEVCEDPPAPVPPGDCILYSSPDRLPPDTSASAAAMVSASALLLLACLMLPAPVPRSLALSCVLLHLRCLVLADVALLLFLAPHLSRLLRLLLFLLLPPTPYRHNSATPVAAFTHFHKKQWQYYFILISVNLRAAPAEILPTPSMTPRGNNADRAATRKARLKLINYFFSNLPISSIAQHDKVKTKNSVVETLRLYLYWNSSNSGDYGGGIGSSYAEGPGWPTAIHVAHTNHAGAVMMLVLKTTLRVLKHSLRNKYVWYSIKTNINETYIKKYSKQRLIKLKKTNRCILVERKHKTSLEYVGLCDLERERNVQCLSNR